MRTLIANVFASLDGVMQAPGGPEEDPSGGFDLGGWSVTYWDDTMSDILDSYADTGYDLVLGCNTYEVFAAHWPYVSRGESRTADRLNDVVKYVASSTLQDPTWDKTVVLSGDVTAQITELKNGDGPELQIHGSAGLLQTLLGAGLIDEFRLWTFPVLLGSGKPVFGPATRPAGLELTDLRQSTTGVIVATYRQQGEVPIGSAAFDEPTEAELERRQKHAGTV